VWWYNGHPDGKNLPVDLSKVESVAVCGIGNVALDCARVLLRPVADLEVTDIAQHALQQLKGVSRVRQVHLCARRGPVQVSGWCRAVCGCNCVQEGMAHGCLRESVSDEGDCACLSAQRGT
jgi:hypothetical protein